MQDDRKLFKNGYVVAELNSAGKAYAAWPLADITDDNTAQFLTDKADEKWFCKYSMQHIVPDLNYAKEYLHYCKSIDLPVKLLLFESFDGTITVQEEAKIVEVLGYDCIGTVYHSYLQSESREFQMDLNQYGLADSLDDILSFIKMRKAVIMSGINLEDFWEETPVRISVIEID